MRTEILHHRELSSESQEYNNAHDSTNPHKEVRVSFILGYLHTLLSKSQALIESFSYANATYMRRAGMLQTPQGGHASSRSEEDGTVFRLIPSSKS